MQPRIYIETTIPSYLVSKSSRDILVLTHQELSKNWWSRNKNLYSFYISDVVLEEISKGDAELAEKRMEIVKDLKLLAFTDEINVLALKYCEYLNLPKKAILDSMHLAYSVFYEIDFLLTWNCKHLANGFVRAKLRLLNDKLGLKTPEICTPEELT